MKIIIFTLTTLIIFSSNISWGEDKIIMKGPAPDLFLQLKSEIQQDKTSILTKGPHGMEKFCYKTDSYIVISKNLLGEGYELSASQPKNMKCIYGDNNAIKAENKLGMYIGMPKNKVIELLGSLSENDEFAIIWHSKTKIRQMDFDVQTYSEFRFVNDLLDKLSVFTTVTN